MSDSPFVHWARFAGKLRALPSFLWQWEAKARGVEMGGPIIFLGRPVISRAPGSTLRLEGENRVFSAPRCNNVGNAQPCVLRTLAPSASLVLGRNVGMSSAVVCAATQIVIGEGTLLGAGAMVLDTDFHQPGEGWIWNDDAETGARPISIGRGCFVGARAIILKGVTLGDRAVIGAGAVVTKNVPAGARAVGNPARILPSPLA